MQPSAQGYVPVASFLGEHLANMAEFQRPELPSFTVHEYSPLMDSSDLTPADWQRIADDIAANYVDYDGFVILHGTDTMAFTASALSFVLQGLGKPVIVTGSQIPLTQLRSDGSSNLLNALFIAANYPIPEVGLFFNNSLYRGNRTTKARADGFDAFDSPNFPPLLEAGIEIKSVAPALGAPIDAFSVQAITPQPIAVLTVYPGIAPEILENLLKPPIKALILRSYGIGNAPGDRRLFGLLKKATEQGVVLVNCTQCLKGRVNMQGYATGHALIRAGVVSGGDMTLEATLAKLHYFLSQNIPVEAVRGAMTKNLRGELSDQN